MPKSKKYKQFTEENGEISYFSVQKTSGDDGACGFAAIYAIAGSNESGETARAKGVNQLQEYIKDPKVRNLIKSELKGFLTSDDGNTQDLIKYKVISEQELKDNVTDKYKKPGRDYSNKLDKLKKKYFGDRLAKGLLEEYGKGNSMEQLLKNYGYMEEKDKKDLSDLKSKKEVATKEFETFVDSKIDAYINRAIANNNFWLSVTENSPGVLGALAEINKINFRVLSSANNSDQMKKECEHISVEGRPIHNLHLQTNVAGTAGFHFEVLKEVRPEQVNVARNSSSHILREDIVMPKKNLGNSKQDEDLLAYGQAMVDLVTALRLITSSNKLFPKKIEARDGLYRTFFGNEKYKKYIDADNISRNNSLLEKAIKGMHEEIEKLREIDFPEKGGRLRINQPKENDARKLIYKKFNEYETIVVDLAKNMGITFSSSSSKQDDLTTESDYGPSQPPAKRPKRDDATSNTSDATMPMEDVMPHLRRNFDVDDATTELNSPTLSRSFSKSPFDDEERTEKMGEETDEETDKKTDDVTIPMDEEETQIDIQLHQQQQEFYKKLWPMFRDAFDIALRRTANAPGDILDITIGNFLKMLEEQKYPYASTVAKFFNTWLYKKVIKNMFPIISHEVTADSSLNQKRLQAILSIASSFIAVSSMMALTTSTTASRVTNKIGAKFCYDIIHRALTNHSCANTNAVAIAYRSLTSYGAIVATLGAINRFIPKIITTTTTTGNQLLFRASDTMKGMQQYIKGKKRNRNT